MKIWFFKKITTKNESVGSIGTPKIILEKKNSIFKKSIISNGKSNKNSEKDLNKSSNLIKDLKNTFYISKTLIKSLNSFKSKEKLNNGDNKKSQINHENSSNRPKLCLTKASK